MKNKIKILIAATIFLAIIPAFVFAFGEVAGPVVFSVPIGGSNVSRWGLSNDQQINVKLSAQGDISKYISFTDSITLPSNNQIYWVNITAKIPSDYNVSQGMNITGTLYAVSEGQPGQVQINLQLKKYAYVLVQPKVVEQSNNLFTGMFALQPVSISVAVICVVIVLFGLFHFARKRKGVKI